MEEKAEKLAQLNSALAEARRVGSIADLAASYVKAWGEIDNVVKNAANPHFGSQYADLGAVLDTVRPIFAKNDLALLTAPGEMEGDKMTLIWMLIHKTGQTIQGRMSLPIGPKATAQAGGSALTYMRRYLSAAVGGIAQVDDDGNAASSDKAPQKKAKAADNATYAETAVGLIERIEGCADLATLEAMKPEVAELGDQRVADAYVAHKKTLKGKK
jgi:hypothetical protein